MSQYRDPRAPCRTYVLVGTVVSPIAFAKRPTYTCSALPATVTLATKRTPVRSEAVMHPTVPTGRAMCSSQPNG